MAKTQKLLIEFGDGGSPEDFAYNCTINTSQEFAREATVIEATDPNCLNPDAPSWTARAVDTLSASISGEGTMETQSFMVLDDYFVTGDSFTVRVSILTQEGLLVATYLGQYVMTNITISKEGKGFVSATLELQSNGAVVRDVAS